LLNRPRYIAVENRMSRSRVPASRTMQSRQRIQRARRKPSSSWSKISAPQVESERTKNDNTGEAGNLFSPQRHLIVRLKAGMPTPVRKPLHQLLLRNRALLLTVTCVVLFLTFL